ncbi:MAG TPA: hypothetical protein DIS99_15080 [Acinetobacter johnsonii]|nr:hypothetical protein [Acinetobacter johnsonii]
MKKLWLCCFLILTSPVFAAERTDYRDPANLPKAVNNFNKSFESMGKQTAYMQKYASGKMDNIISQINGEHKVRTMIRDSGYDPDTGKKIRIEANVTQTANKAKVASTLVDRLGKAKDYAKHVGKASIPAFVGGAAVQALVDGVGWVMDPKNNTITKKDDSVNVSDKFKSKYKDKDIYASGEGQLCTKYAENWKADNSPQNEYPAMHYNGHVLIGSSQLNCKYYYYPGATIKTVGIPIALNPNYQQPQPQTEVTDDELKQAFEDALNSNNPALASAIAQAIKDAYTPEGKIAVIGDEQANGLAVDAADTARDAVNKAANNTGSEPSSKGKPGYYNITDGDKTIEGNVYETTPTGTITPQPDTGTGTEPGTGTGTGTGTSTGGATFELPAFCEWAGIVCDFIEWYKTQPEDDSPELPEHEIEKKEIDKELLNVSGSSCPQDLTVNWTGLPFGITINESFEMQPYCNELEPLKYVFILITTCLCAFMFVRL